MEQVVLTKDFKGQYTEAKYVKVLSNGWKFQYYTKAPFTVRVNEQMMVPANCPFQLLRGQSNSDLTLEISTCI